MVSIKKISIILLLLLLTITAVNAEDTWYVSSDADTTGDGSIDHPFKTLEEGLNANKGGDSIYLYPGTYYINDQEITKDTTITGENKENTIIDGNASNRLFLLDNNAKLTLTNLTLNNTDMIEIQESGGAILINSGTLTAYNCNFNNHRVKYGGGIYNYDGEAYLYNCNFNNNYALTYSGCDGGSGIYNLYGNIYVYNSKFKNNTAIDQQGVAIYNNKGIMVTENCTFTDNNSTVFWAGGAIYCNDKSYSNITNCNFTGNQGWLGGAIYTANGLSGVVGYTNIKNCNFNNNRGRYDGGAIYNYWELSILTIENCNFDNNTARSGGTIYNRYSTITLKNNTITNSYAKTKGTAIYNEGGKITETYLTIAENKTYQTPVGQTIQLNITLTDDMANSIVGEEIILYKNNQKIDTLNLTHDIITYNYTPELEEEALISANYTKTLKNNLKTSIINTLPEIETEIKMENTTIIENTNSNLTGTLKDLNGNPVIGQHIQLNLTRTSSNASKIYDLVTDYTGSFNIPINLQQENILHKQNMLE